MDISKKKNNINEKNNNIFSSDNKLKKLAKKSLDDKWIQDQSKNLKSLLSPCPFCIEILKNKSKIYCRECLIPKIICDNEGYNGLIGSLYSKYGNVLLRNLSKEEYGVIREALIEIASKGTISVHIEKKINEMIK